MRKLLLFLAFLFSDALSFSQNINVDQITISAIDQGVKVNVVAHCFSGAYLATSNYALEGNVITVKACYAVTPLAIVVNLNDDIVIPLEWEYDIYDINVSIHDTFQSETQICNYDAPSAIFNYQLLSTETSEQSDNSLSVFPNPTTGIVRFKNTDIANVSVFDVSGRLVYSEERRTAELNLESLPDGIYFIKAFSERGISIAKIILNK